jgi:hypothetical protein
MDFQLFKKRVYGYLSYLEIAESTEVDEDILKGFNILTENNTFSCRYAKFTEPKAFMKKEPYESFLNGAVGYYFYCCTLGDEVDKWIETSDKSETPVFDACANAYLELKNDEIRLSLGDDLSYLFCPGYQGSDLSDAKEILDKLNAEKLGIRMLDSGFMTPSKSMAGFFAVGISPKKKCGSCIMLKNCMYRKSNEFCYSVVK